MKNVTSEISNQYKSSYGGNMKKISLILVLIILMIPVILQGQNKKSGDDALGIFKYDDFERPEACGSSCHTDFFHQWTQMMMSQCYTHHWDDIEYFKLAVPHADKDPKVAGVKAGCNGCHSPIAFMSGDVKCHMKSM